MEETPGYSQKFEQKSAPREKKVSWDRLNSSEKKNI